MADFDAAVPFLELAFFDDRQGALGIERPERPPRRVVFEGEAVPKVVKGVWRD